MMLNMMEMISRLGDDAFKF